MPVYEASPLVDMHEAVSAWFLGPQAENFDLLKHLFDRALSDQATVRKNFHPEDGVCVLYTSPLLHVTDSE